jgi:hypothetical protein
MWFYYSRGEVGATVPIVISLVPGAVTIVMVAEIARVQRTFATNQANWRRNLVKYVIEIP